MSSHSSISAVAIAAALGLTLAGCTATENGEGADADADKSGGKVTLIVHDSFPNDEFAAAASKATGYDVEVVSAGDGGELTNQLVLTKGAPLADAFFGVDNTFASRLIENEVVEPYAPKTSEPRRDDLDIDGALTAIDHGFTCINVDSAWFDTNDLEAPDSYQDLADPAYKDLTALIDPSASSVGANFLAGTVSEFGEDGYLDYWQQLADNGVRIEQGWSDAYYGQFTGASEDGTKPIVLSYNTSPVATLNEDETASTTAALTSTCSTQVEYAGVLQNAENPEGAKAVVDYLLSPEFQATVADVMYVYPSLESVELPESWEKFAPIPEEPHDLSAAEIGEHREDWLRALDEVIGQ